MVPIPDLTSIYQSPDIEQKRLAAEAAQTSAGDYSAAASLLPSKLRDAIQGKLDYNKDLIESKNKAMADYFSAPSAARSQYANIFNPFERERLVAQSTANAYMPYQNLTDILGQRMGTINDIVSAGTGAFQATVTEQENQAQQARQAYQDALSLAGILASGKQWQYEQQTKKQTGTGLGGNLGGGQKQQIPWQPTEPKPTMTPNDNTRLWSSPEGQWIWDTETNDWVPVGD